MEQENGTWQNDRPGQTIINYEICRVLLSNNLCAINSSSDNNCFHKII